MSAHVSNTMSCSENVLLGDERASADLSVIVQESSDPGPLTLVRRPPIHHPEGMLTIVINSLLLFSNSIIAIITDGMVLSNTSPRWVATVTIATANSFSFICNYRG